MHKFVIIMLLSLSVLEIACTQEKNVQTMTDADIQLLKQKIEKDDLWKEYISTVHDMTKLVTSKSLYVNDSFYKNPPEIESKLANVKSDEEARQVLINFGGYTEANADLTIKWLKCVSSLQQKFPEMIQVGQQRLNLKVPLPTGIPSPVRKKPVVQSNKEENSKN